MKSTFFLLATVCIHCFAFSQMTTKDSLLAQMSVGACNCIDSIRVNEKSNQQISSEIKDCIDKSTGAYQLAVKLAEISHNAKTDKQDVNISVDLNTTSKEYKTYYFELERYLMGHCPAIKEKAASNDKRNLHSLSQNPDALDLYYQGIDASKAGDLPKALSLFQKAVAIDSVFAFAWDNIGITYRKMEDYDNAIKAYQKSLSIDPEGKTPLQNIAVVYQYTKEFNKAIDAYKKLSELDASNPEVFYGIGLVYALNMHDNENGLTNICKAYNLYLKTNSPYRTDAEKIIQIIYQDMKKNGKEEKFHAILKENHITAQ